MKYRIVHTTEYTYQAPVTLCHNEVHLRPRDFSGQRCLSNTLDITPPPSILSRRADFFGNEVGYFAVQTPHEQLSVTATSEVQTEAETQLHFQSQIPWNEAAERLARDLHPNVLEARQYVFDSPSVQAWPGLADYAAHAFPPGRPLGEAVHDLMARIHQDFAYDPDFTTVATPLTEVFEHRRGVCQDFAHLAIACLRSRGLAARYVSGYIETDAPPGGVKLVGADASHAWFAVFDPDLGWLDFDPTNNQIPMDRHITTAWGRDYADITPLKGVIYGGGTAQKTRVAVDVARIE